MKYNQLIHKTDMGTELNKKDPVKLGNINAITGDYAYYGEWEKSGIDLALEEINCRGGINGRPVEVIREDDRADPVCSMEAVNKLIHVDKVQAIVGLIRSDNLIADAPFAKKNKVVLLSTGAGAVTVPSAGGYVFQIYPITSQIGKRLVEAAAQRGNKTAAVIYINNAYGMDLTKTIRREAPAAGIEILAAEGYKSDNKNFAGQLSRIKAKKPNVVFMLGFPVEMGLILKQARELRISANFFAPDTFAGPIVESVAGDAAEGIVYVMPNDTFPPEFIDNFKKKHGSLPNHFSALGYDALNLLALAIGRGGYNGEAIKNELLKVVDYQGASGVITFDESGQAINRPLQVRTIKKGKAVDYLQ